MAITFKELSILGKISRWAQLLTDQAAATSGEWVNIAGWEASIEVEGITTATVQIRGSNRKVQPASSFDGFQLGSDITADKCVALDAPVTWIKVMISSWTGGTINAYLQTKPK